MRGARAFSRSAGVGRFSLGLGARVSGPRDRRPGGGGREPRRDSTRERDARGGRGPGRAAAGRGESSSRTGLNPSRCSVLPSRCSGQKQVPLVFRIPLGVPLPFRSPSVFRCVRPPPRCSGFFSSPSVFRFFFGPPDVPVRNRAAAAAPRRLPFAACARPQSERFRPE